MNNMQQVIAYRITRNHEVLDKYNVVAIIGVDEKGDELVGFEVLTQVEFEDAVEEYERLNAGTLEAVI
jgi:hypothetical protein